MAYRACEYRRQLGQRNLQSSTPEPSNVHVRRRLHCAEIGRPLQGALLRPLPQRPSRLRNVFTPDEATCETSLARPMGYRGGLIYHRQTYL